MRLFCSINFQFVPPERYVFRKIASNKTSYSQNCVSPDVVGKLQANGNLHLNHNVSVSIENGIIFQTRKFI